MSLQPSQTFVNHDRQIYALANESASKWYTFPSQTGEVLLVDASGTQVLQSVDGNLFYNQELLAKAGDIQQISEWSDYPVLNPAGVDFNGNPLLNATTIEATGDISGGANITLVGNVTAGGSLSGSGVAVTGAITGGSLSVASLPKPFTPGELNGDSLTVSGAAAVGSVTSTGAVSGTTITGSSTVQGAGLATTAGLDMANTAITRASAVNISNAGFAPYGQLTSPNGTQLLWNGATIQTGGGGDVSQWANFNAVTTINANSNPITNVTTLGASGNITTATNVNAFAFNGTNVEATNIAAGPIGSGKFCIMTNNSITSSTTDGLTISVPSNNLATTVASGTITNTATGILNNVGNNFEVTADGGLNPLITPNVNLTAKNGNGGQVNVVADPGSIAALGGVVNITGNGGTILIPQPPPTPPTSVTVGGEVNITATTGSGAGLYTATSAINLNAASINSYAGAIPPIGSLLGYNFIYGNLGVSVCAGLPSSGLQFPGTAYIYGLGIPGVAGGVRIQSPQGIQMLSDTYIENLYPLDGGGLNIQGRSLPTGYVNIKDVAVFEMTGFGHLKTDFINSKSGNGLFYEDTLRPFPSVVRPGIEAYTIKPPVAQSVTPENLVISGNPFPALGYVNYVDIQNANAIAFDASGAGALSGVQSINGAAWPPPTGDASLWSQYPQTSVLDSSGYGIVNLTTINGQPVGDLTPAGWWAYPAGGNVDISGNGLTQLASIATLDGFTLTSAGSVGIFADTSAGNISIATNGGGDVNIGTGNAGDINIATSGAGNEVTVAGDIVNLQGTQGVRVDAPVLDLAGNSIYNVNILRGSTASTLTVNSLGLLDLTATGDVDVTSNSGSVVATALLNADVTATNGAVGITAGTQADVNAPVINLNAVTVNANGALAASSVSTPGDVVSSSGSTPYSLNTIGALVSGNQQYDYWVAVNGSDVSGNGSVIKPFASVTAALAATVSISDALPINIRLTAGTYTENPTITRNNTFLVGNVGVADAVIIGTVTFDPTATATVSQGMSGITVVGNVVCNDTITFDINWYIQFCNITSYTAAALNAFSTGSGNNTLNINNTIVTQNVTVNTAIVLNSVRLNAIQAQINNTTTGACVSVNGTGSMSLFGCVLTSAGAATASALVTYINAVGNGTPSSFSLNTFTYTAGTVGAAKAAFFFNNAGSLAGSTVINGNVFNLPGAAALIQRPGIGSIAIAFGANTTSIQTIPAAGSGLTYTYTTSTPLSATALYDQTGSAGTNLQVLGCGAGGGLQWRSLTNTSLGTIPQAASTSAYQNQPLFYNTVTGAINYIGVADDVTVQPCPATFSPIANNKNTTFILTSTGASTFTLNNNAGTPLTANDVGWYMYVKNGNGTNGGDITINGVLVSGNTVVHNQTAVQNGQIVIVRWTGTAFVVY